MMKRLTLQQLYLPKAEGISIDKELYVRGDYQVVGKAIIAKKTLSFNTYFNSFSIYKWRLYTGCENVTVIVDVEGCAEVTVVNSYIANGKITEVVVATKNISGPGTITIPPSDYEGILYLTVSGNQEYTVKKINYEADVPNYRDIKLSIGICTFRREDYVYNNIKHLNDNIINRQNSCLYDKLEVFISDNGHTLEKNKLGGEKIHLYPNRNYGGAGGFTRTIIESQIKNAHPSDYIILMDDDIVLDYQVLERTWRLLSSLKPDYYCSMIGGALLAKGEPHLQVENGCYFSPDGVYLKVNNNYDLRNFQKVVENEIISDANYNGWYYCCIPASVINEENLPLPIFIHYDDADYGTRNPHHQIQMMGISVWHPNTVGKDPLWMNYYNSRNLLILQSRGDRLTRKFVLKQLMIYYLSVVSYDYKTARLGMQGIHDYYKGPVLLKNTDPLDYHQKLSKNNKYAPEPLPERIQWSSKKCSLKKFYIKGLLRMFIPSFGDIAYVERYGEKRNVFSCKRIGVVDDRNKNVCYYDKSIIENLKISVIFLFITICVVLTHDIQVKKWHQAYKDFTKLSFWNKYLGL